MKEIIESIVEELKRVAAEGDEFAAVDDDCVGILKALAESSAPSKPAPQKTAAEEFVDDVEPVRFASASDIEDMKKTQEQEPKSVLKVVVGADIAPIPEPKPFAVPTGSKAERLAALRGIVLSDKVCAQHVKAGKKIVFGVGNADAEIFFCGEAPGADEEIQGEPFVGKAGQLLTKIIGAMGLGREDVYIGNIMNWRPETPKGNRPPTEEEMRYCLPYLKAQIEIVKPKVVVALGATAVNGLLGADPTRRMGKVRGTWQSFEGADLMITYHPSFLLQYASAQMKRLVWEDMMAVMERVGISVSEKQRGYFLPKE